MEDPALVRSRFAALVCHADGEPCDPAQLTVRSMNFGQHWRSDDVREVTYDVVLPSAYVAHVLARELPSYLDDFRAHPFDEEGGGLGHTLERAGYPSPEVIVTQSPLLLPALDFFGHDLLLGWLGDGPRAATPRYVINTIDRFMLTPDGPCLAGLARRHDGPVRYQDV